MARIQGLGVTDYVYSENDKPGSDQVLVQLRFNVRRLLPLPHCSEKVL